MQLLLNCVHAGIVLCINSQVNLNRDKMGKLKKKSSRNECSRNWVILKNNKTWGKCCIWEIVQSEKINHTQRKIKEYIHTRNRNATWIAKCWRTNMLQIK